MGKRIGLTFDLKENWQSQEGDPHDASAEFDKPHVLARVVQAIESGGHTVQKIGNVDDLLAHIDTLNVDIVFNLCEGISGRNRESQVPLLLEMKGIPYVGSDALTLGLTLDKIIAKKIFLSEAIPTPKFFEITDINELDQIKEFKFPLIVKTRHEGSSKGISLQSRVEDMDSLRRQVQLINDQYKQPALVEEFIRGTEFTVAVLGNGPHVKAMPVIQVRIDGSVDLGDKFYTFHRIYSPNLQYVCPAQIDEVLTKKIQALAVKVYLAVESKDFGRVDFRVDEDNNPYVLEINPLPSLDPEDAFGIFSPALGTTYDDAVLQVIDFALARYGLSDLELRGFLSSRETVGIK